MSPDQVSPQPDVIPVRPRTAPSRAAWVAVVLLMAALAAAITVTVHYRADAVYRSTTALPTSGTLAGMMTVFTAHASPRKAQIVLSARIRGGLPHTRYELSGNACTSN